MLRAKFGSDCEMDGRAAQKIAYKHNPEPKPKRTINPYPESIRQFVKDTDDANNGEPISAEKWNEMLRAKFGSDCKMDGKAAQKIAYKHNPEPKSRERTSQALELIHQFVKDTDDANNGEPISAEKWNEMLRWIGL